MVDEARASRKRPNIYDVAEQAGVSHMTVSRVLNGAPHIKSDTRAKVQAAIDAINYQPSSAARTLVTRRTMRVGALVDSITDYGPSRTLLALERAAREKGYGIATFSHRGSDSASLSAIVADLERQGIDALCVIGPRLSTLEALRDLTSDIPVVVAGADQREDFVAVDVDQSGGATAATQHLLDLGHRSLLHLAGPADSAVAQARRLAFEVAARRAGAAFRVVVGDWTSDFGHQIGAYSDRMPEAPTAVFAGNDQMALGLVHGLWSQGVRVPEDVSVVGFDDIPGAAHLIPPLTTIAADLDRVGQTLLDSVVGLIEGLPIQATRIGVDLKVRLSTAAAKA